ncbi:MAG: type II toxin-antitoxin system PemK/MazF family toxin [Rhodopila sp.]|nr:type II toxin-antitoxin system PemK/MazF family toxin [Rhodopila sp.]
MASFEVWDVVKVPFPYTNRPIQQHRPALVIAHHSYAGSPALLWVLMITSASHRRWAGDIPISDLSMAGLPAASIVRSAKIATIEALDAERIGCLPASDCSAVRRELAGLIGRVIGTHLDAPA